VDRNTCRSSCKVALLLPDFNHSWNLLINVGNNLLISVGNNLLISVGNNPVSNFKEICLTRTELMLADGRTDMAKLTFASLFNFSSRTGQNIS
jgi:hypothetical protein